MAENFNSYTNVTDLLTDDEFLIYGPSRTPSLGTRLRNWTPSKLLLDSTAFVDPGADRVLFWDDSVGAYSFLTFGSGLNITGTTATVSANLTSDVSGVLPIANGGTNAATAGAAFNNIVSSFFADKVLSGLRLSNNVTDATNDIDIAAGACVSDDGTTIMNLSAITKRLDAAWAVGTNQGGLDTGSVANDSYHLWVINRPDTNVTDVLFSLSATAPTMPTNYTKKKCIGAIKRESAAINGFYQNGREFYYNTPPAVYDSGAGAGTSEIFITTGVPSGARFKVFGNMTIVDNGNYVYLSSRDNADVTPSTTVSPLATGGVGTGATVMSHVSVWTNTSAQIRGRQSNSGNGFKIATLGWLDPRI